jgi:hypothetical protein
MFLLSTAELGTESAAELWSGPATELGSPRIGAGGYRVAEPWAVSILGPTTELGRRLATELKVATWRSHGFLFTAEPGTGTTTELRTVP